MTSQPSTPAMTDADAPVRLWCGSYTPPNGSGRGVAALTLPASGRIGIADVATRADSPSFLAAHPSRDVLYAVAEFDQTVRAYRVVAGGWLEALGEPWLAGDSACHVAVDPLGRYLSVTCWGSGEVFLYDLDPHGAIVARHRAAAAADPYPGPDRVSRAHATLILPDGRVLTTDLGFDLVRVWTYQPGIGLVADHEVPLGAGSGPRHLAWHPDGYVYVVTEHSIEVVILATHGADAGTRLAIVGRTPATARGAQPGDAAAEISVDPAGLHAYVSVRGSNVISTLAVHDGGARLEPVGDVDCGGDWPRHHLQQGHRLYVANERSSTVTTLRLDPETGLPVELVDTIAVGSPTCLVRAA